MIETLVAYKLMRRRKDGSLGPLYINRSQRIPMGRWLRAQTHPTNGFAIRHGWHACLTPEAPHLVVNEERVWAKVEVRGFHYFQRPIREGGTWVLAKQMRVLELIENDT
jgi:hypothetical protein